MASSCGCRAMVKAVTKKKKKGDDFGSDTSSMAAKKKRGGARSKAGSSAASAAGSKQSKATSHKKKTAASELRCDCCLETPGRCRWGDTRVADDGDMIAVETRCWDCKEEWQSRMQSFPDWSMFVEWAMTDEGQRALEVSAHKKPNKSLAEPVTVREVRRKQTTGCRFYRDCWIANSTEFKVLMDKIPNAKMPGLPTTIAPTEKGDSWEKVYVWAVGHKVYPLRKMQMWCDIQTNNVTEEMAGVDSLKCKTRAAAVWKSSMKKQRTEWSQEVLYGNAHLMTIDDFCTQWGAAAPSGSSDLVTVKALFPFFV